MLNVLLWKMILDVFLSFTFHRTEGTFGDVRVNYQLVYSRNYPDSLNGFVVIGNAERDVSSRKNILVE